MRSDAYLLRNLPLGRKLLGTAALLAGMALLALTWSLPVSVLRWSYSDRMLLLAWGESLGQVAAEQPRLYGFLAALSLAGQGLLYAVSRRLFRRSALRRQVRRALSPLGAALLVANAAVWAALPHLGLARALAGPVALLAHAVLLALAAVPIGQMWVYHRGRRAGGQRRVVIVGGGFAGLYAALELDRKLGHDRDLEVVVVDRNNYFLFPPLLPSAATGAIEIRQVTYPFRRIFETTNVRFEKTSVERIDPLARRIHTAAGPIDYDFLLLAPGSETNTFRTPGAAEHAFLLRELKDAIALRDRIIDCFEQAAGRAGRGRPAAVAGDGPESGLLRFVVVGGGPTGVEVATEIHDLVHHVLLRRYPEIEPRRVEVCLVHSGPRILSGWDEAVVRMAEEQLASLRIRLVVSARVTAIGPDHVRLQTAGGSEVLATANCVWCAGVRPSPLVERAGLPLDRSGRARVDPDLRAPGFGEVFVLGDAACLLDQRTGKPLPPLGQVAFQQGPHAAGNVVRLLEGQPTRPFRYFDFGALVSVGEHFAAVNLLGVRLSGFPGWFVWRTLYLAKLVGLSSKVRVMLDWTLDLLVERSIAELGSAPRPGPEGAGGDVAAEKATAAA